MLGLRAILIALLVCLLILRYLKQMSSQRTYPPGLLRLPIIGSIWRFAFYRSKDLHIELAKQYGNIYTIWLGPKPVIVLSGFEAVKEGLINHSKDFVDRPASPFLKAVAKEKGIILSNGHTWKQQRKFGTVAMRKLGLGKKGLEHQIEEEAQQLTQTFASAKGQPFDPSAPITNSVSNVICVVAFGHRFSMEDKEFLNLIDAIGYMSRFLNTVFYDLYEALPWLMEYLPGPHKKAFECSKTVQLFAKKEMEKHKEHEAVLEPQDFIDFYLFQMKKNKNDPNSTYNEDNLTQCIFDLFIAGTETTSLTLQWALLLMANHPDIQEKVHKEMEKALGSSQVFNYQDWKKLPYTNAVIHEIQRSQYILITGLPRQTTKDVNILGFVIPKGTMIYPDLRSVLLDPKEWETPEAFNPNHFLDKDGNFVEREAFLPFGAGARVCLGEQLAKLELFIFFIKLLRSFTFQVPKGVKEFSTEPIFGLSLPPQPYKICAIPRCGAS
ncbi:cytochrome P450 2J2-like [Eublepharis macularius]|uniref:Cytochrome P450 2J2-like n=1 Tax=Eublepharis macularius TaxID=481883 RepID=A0AA97L1A4_EUBMA|nr:cytochrome P450 2J2-like [Eublepharis macularius]